LLRRRKRASFASTPEDRLRRGTRIETGNTEGRRVRILLASRLQLAARSPQSVRATPVQAFAEGAAMVTSNVRHFESVVRAMECKDVPDG